MKLEAQEYRTRFSSPKLISPEQFYAVTQPLNITIHGFSINAGSFSGLADVRRDHQRRQPQVLRPQVRQCRGIRLRALLRQERTPGGADGRELTQHDQGHLLPGDQQGRPSCQAPQGERPVSVGARTVTSGPSYKLPTNVNYYNSPVTAGHSSFERNLFVVYLYYSSHVLMFFIFIRIPTTVLALQDR